MLQQREFIWKDKGTIRTSQINQDNILFSDSRIPRYRQFLGCRRLLHMHNAQRVSIGGRSITQRKRQHILCQSRNVATRQEDGILKKDFSQRSDAVSERSIVCDSRSAVQTYQHASNLPVAAAKAVFLKSYPKIHFERVEISGNDYQSICYSHRDNRDQTSRRKSWARLVLQTSTRQREREFRVRNCIPQSKENVLRDNMIDVYICIYLTQDWYDRM